MDHPFRPRLEALLAGLFPDGRRPAVRISDDSASWIMGDSEVWATDVHGCRLTMAVLLAHRYRLQVSMAPLMCDPGIRVSVVSKAFAPDDPVAHHPGLSDLVESCYSCAGRVSPASILARLERFIRLAAVGLEPGEDPATEAALADLDRLFPLRR